MRLPVLVYGALVAGRQQPTMAAARLAIARAVAGGGADDDSRRAVFRPGKARQTAPRWLAVRGGEVPPPGQANAISLQSWPPLRYQSDASRCASDVL